MNDKLEISQEIFRRMNESGQTNYLHSLFLNLSVEKIVQNMNNIGSTNNFSKLFPLKTKPNQDPNEMKKWHIANNIVFLFLKKHHMNLSIKTALLEFSPDYIQNKEEVDLKAKMHCPKSDSLIQSLIKFNLIQNNKNSNYNENKNTKISPYNSKNTNSNSYNSNNSNSNVKFISRNSNNSKDSNNSRNYSSNNYYSNENYTNNSSPSRSNSNKETINISINRYKKRGKNRSSSANNSQVEKVKKTKKIEKLERGTKSPKSNRVTIKWDMTKSGTGSANYTYNTYDNSGSENYQYYDSICYESEEASKSEMKILSNSKGSVRKVDLLRHSIFNFNHSKLEELLEIKRQSLSSKMFSYQVTVTIIEAKDLTIIDFLSSLDPFCTIQLDGSDIFKTKVMDDTKTPVWNSTFGFVVEQLDADSCLTFEIYDSDPLGTDKKLSTLQLYLFEVMDKLTITKWFEMQSDTIFKLLPQLHLRINVDLKEKEKQGCSNNQADLESPDSYNYDLESPDDNQDGDNKLHF